MTQKWRLRGPSARVLRVWFKVSTVVFGVSLFSFIVFVLVNFGQSWVRELGAPFGVAFIAVFSIPMVTMAISGWSLGVRRERELIAQVIGSGQTGELPYVLAGAPLTVDDRAAAAPVSSSPTVEGPPPSTRLRWGWLVSIVVAALGAWLFSLGLAAGAQIVRHGGLGTLGLLLSSTAALGAVPWGVALAMGAIRDASVLRRMPGAFLVSSARTPPMEFALVRLGLVEVVTIGYWLVWSFDQTSAAVWQGPGWARRVAFIPRDRIVGVASQDRAELVNARATLGRLVLLVRGQDGVEVPVPFIPLHRGTTVGVGSTRRRALGNRIARALGPR